MTESMEEEQHEEFMEELYARDSAENTAKQQLREHMEAAGIQWDEEI